MKKKLFNYFLQKVVQQEQSFLKSDNTELTALAIIFSKMSVHRQYASGASTETIYFCAPKYAEELFLVLCMDAATHGDNLLQVFNFHPSSSYICGHQLPDMKDDELANYLAKEVYPETKDLDNAVEHYTKLSGLPKAEMQDRLRKMKASYIRKVNTEVLANQPEPCAETAMIDRAWDRLMKDKNFTALLDSGSKHKPNGYSNAYAQYSKSPFLPK